MCNLHDRVKAERSTTSTREALERLREGNRRFVTSIRTAWLRNDGLLVVGAEYSLETGVVEFFDGAEPG